MMGKYDFLFSTPQNSYLDQALPPISRAPVLARPNVPAMQNRPQLTNEMMAALTGRNLTRPMSLPMRSPVRIAQSNSPIPLPTSQPSQYTGALPISKPMKPFTPLPPAAGTAQMMRPSQPSDIPASPEQAPAPSSGFFGGLLGDGFDDPKSQGILAASAALLEAGAPVVGGVAPSLGQALGQGLRAGMGAYGAAKKGITDAEDAEINRRYKIAQADLMDRKMKTPTREQIQNGAFTVVTDPETGEQKIVPNEEIIKYQKEMKALTKTEKKPIRMSTAAFKAEDEDFTALDLSDGINDDVGTYIDLIQNKKMSLNLFDKPMDKIRTSIGQADEDVQNRANFDAFLNKLRNDTLRLNKGTQTEGDAERALLEIVANKTDEKIVVARLQEIQRINERAIKNRRRAINRRRKNEGVDVFDFSTYNDVKFKEVD
jgi:hypothetical protein